MRLSIAAVASLLLVSACDSGGADTAPTVEPAEPAPKLAGVDLTRPVRLVGTEPFWGIELTGSEVVYSGLDRPEQRGPQSKPVVQGTVATLATETAAGTGIEITLTATECSDGMSDRTYPLTALVKVGEETLMGCGASSAAFAAAGESGPVVEQPAAPAA
ncbi:COG3650 family protein [Brevundimonas lenta]|uniref:Putative membrane protein n=1 Tax=Brevundimonas lenta TaxID=424796 RepID=A0A7W6NNK5_9CAUL|nr:hypothetical protein [Brevundimonas lenta]MBB4081242.1 putative membrane protein [Brevundimonas lenta]